MTLVDSDYSQRDAGRATTASDLVSVDFPLLLRGRRFTSDDLNVVINCISEYFDKGRTYISVAICKKLDWRQPNGWLKDRACRDVLRALEQRELIKLPPSLVSPRVRDEDSGIETGTGSISSLSQYDFVTPVTEFPKLVTLMMAKSSHFETTWNAVVNSFHPLGHSVTVGRSIKYLIMSDDVLLGALAFSSPAWQLTPRDSLLLSLGLTEGDIHSRVIDNTRFLLLPNVQVPNLASHVLSLATRQIVRDWTAYYSITPLVAETFVQSSVYEGTCYLAANWIPVGVSKGYAKKGASHRNSQEPKLILLYGLDRHWRRKLTLAVPQKQDA
jgi:hypothetical protein